MTYGEFGVALLAAFFVTPLILRTIGARDYGLWLSSGELIGYFALLDFGVFAVLPWLVAHADGRKRSDEIARDVAHTLVIAVSVALVVLLVTITCGRWFTTLIRFTETDWMALRGPLLLLILLVAINLPLGIFISVLHGLQDVKFYGTLNIIRAALGPVITVILLLNGQRFYALALGTASLAPLIGAISFFRLRRIAPQLLQGWRWPRLSGLARLFRESIGAWLANAGVQLMERSSAVILAFLQFPALVPVLVCTSRLARTLTQMAWVMPDSSLVAFAQLSGEGNKTRTREVALAIIKLAVVVAALPACIILAINPGFVRFWVGPSYFGGLPLNLLLAAEVISGSIVHALATVVSVNGNRLQVGTSVLFQGTLYIATALVLSRHWLLEGLIAADLVAPFFTTVPTCLLLLRSRLDVRVGSLLAAVASIVLRAGPCLLAAGFYGWWRAQQASIVELALVGVAVTVVYLRLLATEISTFPLPAPTHLWLKRLRLI
jgi:O-antigen/teichoic acid export membrane protein